MTQIVNILCENMVSFMTSGHTQGLLTWGPDLPGYEGMYTQTQAFEIVDEGLDDHPNNKFSDYFLAMDYYYGGGSIGTTIISDLNSATGVTFIQGDMVKVPMIISHDLTQMRSDVNYLNSHLSSNYDHFTDLNTSMNTALSDHENDAGAHPAAMATKQNLHANLTALSSQTLATDKMLYAASSTTFGGFDSTSYGRALLDLANQTALQTAVGVTQYTDEMSQDAVGSIMSGSSGAVVTYNDAANTILITNPRTTSTLSLSLVGTGATGTQIHATKDASIKLNVSTSTTSTIGGPSTSLVSLKICATNNATEGSWTTVAILENDQTITLALVLNSTQVMKGQLVTDVPTGWYVKLVNSGSGTHSEAFISGQQTIYG